MGPTTILISALTGMKTVAEYREFARMCRELAAQLVNPKDKRAVELMAAAGENCQ